MRVYVRIDLKLSFFAHLTSCSIFAPFFFFSQPSLLVVDVCVTQMFQGHKSGASSSLCTIWYNSINITSTNTTQVAKMSTRIDPKFVELTADVLKIFFIKNSSSSPFLSFLFDSQRIAPIIPTPQSSLSAQSRVFLLLCFIFAQSKFKKSDPPARFELPEPTTLLLLQHYN